MRQRVKRHGLAAVLAASPRNRYSPFSYLLSLLLLCVRRIKQNDERCVIIAKTFIDEKGEIESGRGVIRGMSREAYIRMVIHKSIYKYI